MYDGVNPYADFAADGSLTTRYLVDPRQWDGLLARVGADGVPQWYLRDNINSVRQIVGPDGTVLNAITCDSFGNIASETNPVAGDRFQYTGREYDAELGLYYYRARYYDPSTGRFLSEDPLSFAAGDSNLYRYVFNTPTLYTDPSGLDRIDYRIDGMGHTVVWYVPERWFWRGDGPWKCVGVLVQINGQSYVRRYVGGQAMYVPLHKVQATAETWADTPKDWDQWFRQNRVTDFSSTVASGWSKEFGVDLTGTIAELHRQGLDAYRNQYVTGLAVTAVGLGAIATYRGYRSWQLARAPANTSRVAILGNKLDYLFGKAKGDPHSVQRSLDMLRQMERIGLPDTPEIRRYTAQYFQSVLNDPTNIAQILPNGRVMRESLLMGPRGGVKVVSIWEENRLITFWLERGG